jgi:hypothetical protein
METLEARLQKRKHLSLYALFFLAVLLGLSVLLERGQSKSLSLKNIPEKGVYSTGK